MTAFDEQDLHRLVKLALDNGTARSVAEARALFRGYTLDIVFDASVADRPEYQAALLTIVALARRVFLGGVRVAGALGGQLVPNLPVTGTLAAAIVDLGGTLGPVGDDSRPLISVTDGPVQRQADFHVRPALLGWRGGVVPADSGLASTSEVMPLASMLAAGLAVSEAFGYVSDNAEVAGRRAVGLSLWDPARDWLIPDDAPPLELLPSRLWLVGLGHLGQAYLWALGLLPYPHGELEVVLQDIDTITRSTESTSILTDGSMVGRNKTRMMAHWAESRGFRTAIHERRFSSLFRVQAEEPSVAFCGVDNATARRALDDAGFALVLEAGLGRGHDDFRTMRIHTLPATKPSSEIWKPAGPGEDVAAQPAYRHLLAEGAVDQCGLTTLAGKAVGAPFVGAVAAALLVSELLRLLHGGTIDSLIDLDLRSVEHRQIVGASRDFSTLNPGYVCAA